MLLGPEIETRHVKGLVPFGIVMIVVAARPLA
jgi:hypothetical protein